MRADSLQQQESMFELSKRARYSQDPIDGHVRVRWFASLTSTVSATTALVSPTATSDDRLVFCAEESDSELELLRRLACVAGIVPASMEGIVIA